MIWTEGAESCERRQKAKERSGSDYVSICKTLSPTPITHSEVPKTPPALQSLRPGAPQVGPL